MNKHVVCKHSACDFYRRSQQKGISDQSPCPKPATGNHCFWYVWAWQMSVWSLCITIQTSLKFSRYRHKKQCKMFDKVTLFCKKQNWESNMRQEPSICFIFSWRFDFSTLTLQPVTCKPTEWGTAWCWLHRTNLESKALQQRSIPDFTGHGTFLRNWLCSLSVSRQMIVMDLPVALDTSFHPLINCVAAVQNLYAIKHNFLSRGRRLVLTCRMVLTFVITVTMVSEWLYYTTGFMTLKPLDLLFCHLASQDAFTTVGTNLHFAP